MDRHQVRFAFLKIMLVVLGVSTWVFWSFIFSTRPEQAAANALTALVRLPASLPSQIPSGIPLVFNPQVKAPPPIEMGVMFVPCWDQDENPKRLTEARWLRLTGRACSTEKVDSEIVRVKNLTNGYSATVILAKADLLTTDFIPMDAGPNEIEVGFSEEAGAPADSVHRFTVERE